MLLLNSHFLKCIKGCDVCRNKVKVEKMIVELKKLATAGSFCRTATSAADTGLADADLYGGGRQGVYDM